MRAQNRNVVTAESDHFAMGAGSAKPK